MNAEIERLLDLVMQAPAPERRGFLERECRDPKIRAEVESLMLFYTDSESWFDPLVQEIAPYVRRAPALAPGDLTGHYRVISLLGIGGMGAVYLAVRADGTFEQEVAIKVVPYSNAAFLLERFERERRILGLLNHPNIARILDAGQGPNGLPYFAMEYVPGETIDTFCERHGLSLVERLRLFLKVCDAVSHAHGRLVVHRDLKPSNVIVNSAGEPKLLDFGIAKVLDPSHAETSSTRLLTPDYASPEQIRGEPVTIATDVYSLGALLYKLLTGCTPHRLENTSALESARIVSERAVPPASTVSPGMPADVDAILQKALHNDPARRYTAVADLSADIRRFLEQRPVLAAPDTFTYRARRYLRRNGWISAIAATAVAFLLASSAVAYYQARRAERRFGQVRQLAHVFLFDVDRSIRNVAGTLEARKLIASSAQRYLRQLEAESGGDIQLEREIAESYERLGELELQLGGNGQRDSGIRSIREAYGIRKRLGDGESTDAGRRRDFIRLVSALANRFAQTSNAQAATVWASEAMRLSGMWVNNYPYCPQALEAARTAYVNEGRRLEIMGQTERALEYMNEGIGFGERAYLADRQNRQESVELVRAHVLLAETLSFVHRGTAALPHVQRALALMEELERQEPENQLWRRVYWLTLSTTSLTLQQLSEKDPSQIRTALDYMKRANLVASDMARDDPQSTLAKDDLITQENRYGNLLRMAKHGKEAAAVFEKASAAAHDLALAVPDNRRGWYLWAVQRVDLGELYLELRRTAAADSILQSADEPISKALALNSHDATTLEIRATQLADLAEAAEILGRSFHARQKMRECVDLVSDMTRRDASVKNYIPKYDKILVLAKRLDVPTSLR